MKSDNLSTSMPVILAVSNNINLKILKMKNLKMLKLLFPLLLLTFIFSCKDSDSDDISKAQPTISVRLVDAPGDYDAVNVEIVDVMIKMEGDGFEDDDENGWISLTTPEDDEIVNLLDFTGGISKVLVERFPIPVGTLSQMRLVLGENNSLFMNGNPTPIELKTPSAQQSGLKVKIDAVIEEGFTYDFVLDFDVDKSIVHAGNSGNTILKPVLYASAEVNSGIIEGTIAFDPALGDNETEETMAYVIAFPGTEDEFEITSYVDDSGAFALWGVPPGNYEVFVKPTNADSDYMYGSALNVAVSVGNVTVIADPIALVWKPGSISGDVNPDMVATITINDANDNLVATMDTAADGTFMAEGIPAGTYTVTVSATNYTILEIANVEVNVDTETALSIIELTAI